MEDFPKEYEDVYTSKRVLKKCNLDLVSTGDQNIDTQKYISMFVNEFKEYQECLFDHLVKITWLMRQFHWTGKRRRINSLNGINMDSAFAVFMRHHVGYDAKFIIRSDLFNKIISYFDDFFPDFDVNNPFETKYEYPYKYVTFEYLWFVHAMPERMELLAKAEKRKMGYSQFMDYILNYINVFNERNGDTYELTNSRVCPPYIKYNQNEQPEIKTCGVYE